MLGLLPGTLKSLVGSSATSAKAAVNALGTIIASAKGNAQTAIFTTSRALSAVSAAANKSQAALAAAQKAGQVGPGARTAALMAQRAQDALGRLISGMHGKPAAQVAYQAATEAFEKGFDATSGTLHFNPAAARNALSAVWPRNVAALGETGKKLMQYKAFLRAAENVDDLSPATVRNAARWIMDDPAADAMIKVIAETSDPAVKRSLIMQLTQSAAQGTGTETVDAFNDAPSE